MKKVKYAIIGFGGIAENRIAKEGFACDKARFAALENAELVGAYDLFAGRKTAAEALGLKWYDSIDAILADPAIDAVYVATNNATHAEISIKALEAGKHVIVEKPIATSIADAKKMVETAAAKKLSLSVDHMMVNNAYNVMAKKYVRSGKLGNVNKTSLFASANSKGSDRSVVVNRIKVYAGAVNIICGSGCRSDSIGSPILTRINVSNTVN